ncbi:MAG: hypothetical protein ABSA77_07865 [Thermoguttaceae bacterium]
MQPEGNIIVEIYGEGKTDVGPLVRDMKPELPRRGVVPIIVHALCGRPEKMLVKHYGVIFLQRKDTGHGLWQKVRFARRQAFYNRSNGAVFVVDSEGDLMAKREALSKGRDEARTSLPMAVGVAHPCIESWLLTDPDAIKRALNLNITPETPRNPEGLPAPKKNRNHNPKTVLRVAAGIVHQELSADQKDQIASAMYDMDVIRKGCPLGFAPFADEVESHIRPLFSK